MDAGGTAREEDVSILQLFCKFDPPMESGQNVECLIVYSFH